MAELEPPMALEAPKAIDPIQCDEADAMVRLDEEKTPELDQKVNNFVKSVLCHSVQSTEFREKLNTLHNLGNAEMRSAAAVSNRMLECPVNAMKNGLIDNSPIGISLVELRKTIEELEPDQQYLLAPRKIFGIIPFGNNIRDYFRRYQSAQTHINDIIERLYSGKDELLKDNAAIEQEKVNLWQLMQQLRQYIYIVKNIDKKLAEKIQTIEASEPEKARVVQEEMLFYARQKRVDFLTQMTVNIQGYLTLEMIHKNNLELIKGVDRATTTTVSALRTAVMTAQALANQKLVLDRITALNTTTSNLIESTSKMLHQQTGEIHEQAANSTIEIDKLKAAFGNIYATMDEIANFKVNALKNMQKTVDVLSDEVKKSQDYLRRARGENVRKITGKTNGIANADSTMTLMDSQVKR